MRRGLVFQFWAVEEKEEGGGRKGKRTVKVGRKAWREGGREGERVGFKVSYLSSLSPPHHTHVAL